jgi:hypothetical protein
LQIDFQIVGCFSNGPNTGNQADAVTKNLGEYGFGPVQNSSLGYQLDGSSRCHNSGNAHVSSDFFHVDIRGCGNSHQSSNIQVSASREQPVEGKKIQLSLIFEVSISTCLTRPAGC